MVSAAFNLPLVRGCARVSHLERLLILPTDPAAGMRVQDEFTLNSEPVQTLAKEIRVCLHEEHAVQAHALPTAAELRNPISYGVAQLLSTQLLSTGNLLAKPLGAGGINRCFDVRRAAILIPPAEERNSQ